MLTTILWDQMCKDSPKYKGSNQDVKDLLLNSVYAGVELKGERKKETCGKTTWVDTCLLFIVFKIHC